MFYRENGLFGQPKVQDAYNIIFFFILDGKQHPKKFGSMDVKISLFKITPDFCS